MRDAVQILVKKEELSLEGIRQFYVNVQKEVRGLVWLPNEYRGQILGLIETWELEHHHRMIKKKKKIIQNKKHQTGT